MDYIQGTDRDQMFLFKESLDSIIEKDNPVRIIDAYVDILNLDHLKFIIPELKTGKPPYNPKLMLKIYIYGYMERIRNSRRLEKETKRNKEMIWLSEGLSPDFKTIADFRKNNRKAIKNVFKSFLKLCNKAGLLSLETVAIDGTKLRGQNSLNNVYKRNEMGNIQKKLEEKMEEYLTELDKEDLKETEELKLEEDKKTIEVVEKLKKMNKYKNKIDEIQKAFNEDEKLETFFSTDKDCRFQSDKGKVRAGYNAQICCDEKNKLIIAEDVTNECNDLNQTTPMVEKLKEIKKEFEIENKTDVIEDAGYFNEQEIVKYKEDEGIELFIPDKKEVNKSRKNEDKIPKKEYEIDNFKYDKENDEYVCPEGKKLNRTHTNPVKEDSGREVIEYQCRECNNCINRDKCTTNKRGRAIKVSVNKEYMDEYKKKMKDKNSINKIEKRKEIVEHPFGTIKRSFGYDYLLLKGFEKVRSEFSFICFIYNFKRVINILGFNQFMELIKLEIKN
jgi:transposase